MHTRLAKVMAHVMGALALLGATAQPNARHDFDFEIGTWTMSPSGNTHVVERLWEGATIARLIVLKPVPHTRGSLLTVYRPGSQQWYIYWVDSSDGSVSAPLVGSFSHGVGTFVGSDVENGRHVLVRQVFSNVSANAFQTVQSISHDGGKTWDRGDPTFYTRRVTESRDTPSGLRQLYLPVSPL
jgi:hypothetical protein